MNATEIKYYRASLLIIVSFLVILLGCGTQQRPIEKMNDHNRSAEGYISSNLNAIPFEAELIDSLEYQSRLLSHTVVVDTIIDWTEHAPGLFPGRLTFELQSDSTRRISLNVKLTNELKKKIEEFTYPQVKVALKIGSIDKSFEETQIFAIQGSGEFSITRECYSLHADCLEIVELPSINHYLEEEII